MSRSVKMPQTLTLLNNDRGSSQNSPGGQYGTHLVKAQLPNQQRTTVSIPTGMTIREALGKALKLRKLEPDMCFVYRFNTNEQRKQRINWDVDVAMLKGDEIIVETRDRFPMHTQISHNFAKSYLSKCSFCQERVISGIRCISCGIEFHKGCAKDVPKLCDPAIEHNNYYRHLLARSSGFSPTNHTNLSTSDSPTNHNRLIRPRARSADENSKHKSKSSNQQPAEFYNNNNNSSNITTSTNSHHDSSHQYDNNRANNGLANNHDYFIDHYLPNQLNNSNFNNQLQPHQHYTTTYSSSYNSGPNHRSFQPQTPKEQQSQSMNSNRELLEERWEIDGEEILPGFRIGQGSFATVYMGNWHGPVALKKLNVKDPSPAQLQNFKNEVVVLKKTRHANVLLFIGYVLKPELIIVTQWCKGRSLYKHLHVEERRDFTNCEIKNIAMGVAQGMEYLHAKNIIHRDLKSNNIFIHDEDDLTVKIGDFGLATFKTHYEGNQQIYHPTGSILWMAPEVIRTKPGVNPFTFQSDVYSYGIVLYELLSRKLPYFDFKHKEALLFLIGLGDPKKSPKLNLDVIGPEKPDGLNALMLECTEREPKKRPLFTSIIGQLKKIKLSKIPRSTSEPLRLNDLNGSLAMLHLNN